MKRKKVIKIAIMILCLVAIAVFILFYLAKKKEQEEMVQQALLAIEYRQQNRALPRIEGGSWEEEYMGYAAIDEAELYIRLVVYNEWLTEYDTEAKKLTLEDFEEYLSSEYNEDGSLRIYEGYEHIRAYVDWYHEGGADDIREYWDELQDILNDYSVQNGGIDNDIVRRLNIEQLMELIEKKNNPSYEIDTEIMKGE